MSSKRKQFKIYGPTHFRATWKKFLEICEREGVSGSHLVRVWVEGYVARKDPGNPQPPLTAYVEGHEDEIAARRSHMIKELLARAEARGGEITFREILKAFVDQSVPGFRRAALAESMAEDLKKLGVVIVYQ